MKPGKEFIRLLRSDLRTVDIYKLILSTNINALHELKASGDYKEWKILFDNYQSSTEEVESMIDNQISEFRRQLNLSSISITYLVQMKVRWYNTLKSTLYLMEEELINRYQASVIELWELFFHVDVLRKDTFVKPLLMKRK